MPSYSLVSPVFELYFSPFDFDIVSLVMSSRCLLSAHVNLVKMRFFPCRLETVAESVQKTGATTRQPHAVEQDPDQVPGGASVSFVCNYDVLNWTIEIAWSRRSDDDFDQI